MTLSSNQESFVNQRTQLISLGFQCLEKLGHESPEINFSSWKSCLENSNQQLSPQELNWLWNVVVNDPKLPTNILKKILSPEQEFKRRPDVLVAKAGTEFGIFLQGLPTLEYTFRHLEPNALIVIEQDLFMAPGREMRFSCRSLPCIVSFTVANPGDLALEAERLRLSPEVVEIMGNQIRARAKSISNAYSVSTRRLQPGRKSEGGKAYDYVAMINQNIFYPLELIRTQVESNQWQLLG
jgi:hypothetical protein